MSSQEETSVDLIYEVVKEALASLEARKGSLETKSGAISAFAGAMFALLIGGREKLVQLPAVGQVLVMVAVILFGLSVVLSTIVTWVRQYRADPNPESLAANYLGAPPSQTRLQLTSNLIGAWKVNSALVERNASCLRAALLAQSFGFVFLGSALFLTIIE